MGSLETAQGSSTLQKGEKKRIKGPTTQLPRKGQVTGNLKLASQGSLLQTLRQLH